MKRCVYTTLHRGALDFMLGEPKRRRQGWFSSNRRWASVGNETLPMPILIRGLEEKVPDEAVVDFAADLLAVRFAKDIGADRGERKGWLLKRKDVQRRQRVKEGWSDEKFERSEINAFVDYATHFKIGNLRRIKPIPLAALVKDADGRSLSTGFRYSYAICRYPAELVKTAPATVATASGARAFLVYWLPKTVDRQRGAGGVVGHAAGERLDRVHPGDVLWIVTVRNGDLRLVARLHVGTVTDRAGAERRLGSSDLWEANVHVLATEGSEEPLREMSIQHLASGLRFVSRTDVRLVVSGGRVNAQQLQTMRELTSGSAGELERAWGRPSVAVAVAKAVVETGSFDPTNDEDARKRVQAAIVQRQGQGKFRSGLLAVYGARCAITHWDVEEVLEAAHICPYRGPATNDIRNGLLLRADLHSLFDMRLLAVNPRTYRVWLHPGLRGGRYREFGGQKMALPVDHKAWPDRGALRIQWREATRGEK